MAKTAAEQRASRQAWYVANRETVKARVRARDEANRDEVLAYKKRWWAKNRERELAKKSATYIENRDAMSAKAKRQYAIDPTKAKARAKAYAAANPEKAKAASKEWRAANAARVAAARKTKYAQHVERERAKGRAYWSAHKNVLAPKNAVRGKAWRIAHPDKHVESESRRRAAKRQTRVEKIDFKAILIKANGLCGICQKTFDLFGIEFDHIIPLARGGTHTTDNIQATHSHCNRAKGAKVG